MFLLSVFSARVGLIFLVPSAYGAYMITVLQKNLNVFISSSEVWVKVTQLCPTLCNPMDYTAHGILQARLLEWVASFSFLQGIFPTQGSNPGLPHCRQILYQLSNKGNPRILEWVAYPFSTRSARSRNWTGVSCIAGGFFTNWARQPSKSDTEFS